ncbi:hypothetical protein [Lentzea flaviverrucosa]|uniref:Lipoprotein n=1 Tax=Lentzea flaviverrucosa TaxID=200379 RepID=A0A1H9X2P2_9PSEU|nr:hypothetical protein [Lentzea flaviverrucosa]RDI20912.1 hypothetical protein DFR72_114131 [Lentzea flaviverrucosa]SES40462.1 hypothetical protein SAMN05216195_113157 [Lentzea flaviverrucosa]
MYARLSIAAVFSMAALAACGTPPPAPVPLAAPTTTTTADVPGADPVAWFEAYCGPMGVSAIASRQLQGVAAAGMAAAKESVVRWTTLAAASHRQIADGVEKLGPLGSDVQSMHERLVKQLRKDAEGFDRVTARLKALEANDVFLERYQQAVAVEMGNAGEQATALFKQIAGTPTYAETFRTNKVCADWQATARAK